MSKKLTPEQIAEMAGNIDWTPTDEKEEKKGIKEAAAVAIPNKSASETLKEFLDVNNIVLTVSPPSENIKTVSDGSIILQAPRIIISYRN